MTDYITVDHSAPIAGLSGTPTSGVAPLTVDFTDTSTGDITGWSWSFGDGGTSTLPNPSHVYTTPDIYSVSLTVTGPGGSDTVTLTDYISVEWPAPVGGFSGTPTSGLAPLTVDFTDASTGNITGWSWSFGDGGTSTLQHPDHLYSTPGLYTVTLTVTGPGGSDTVVSPDYVSVEWPAPSGDFAGTPTSGVAPLTVDFTDLSTGNITDWSWTFGDGGTSTLQNPSYLYTSPGTYSVSLVITGPGGSDTVIKPAYITVDLPAPVAGLSGTPTSGVAPLTVDFTDLSTGTITDWLWDFGDGGTAALQNPTHLYTSPGTYSVSLTVTGPGGSDTTTLTDYITVQLAASATSRNGTGVNPDILTSTSLPVLGGTWTTEVDAGSVGADGVVIVFVYARSNPGTPMVYGELLLDPASPLLRTLISPTVAGISQHATDVPIDPAYVGSGATAQAYLRNAPVSGRLTNAIDIVLGY